MLRFLNFRNLPQMSALFVMLFMLPYYSIFSTTGKLVDIQGVFYILPLFEVQYVPLKII